jgi:hypothetical protein
LAGAPFSSDEIALALELPFFQVKGGDNHARIYTTLKLCISSRTPASHAKDARPAKIASTNGRIR